MELGLEDRCALVVGGSRGIGRAIAAALAQEGAKLAIAARDPDRLAEAAAAIESASGRSVLALSCDVRDRHQVDEMVSTAAAALGGLHVLINSGSAPGGSDRLVSSLKCWLKTSRPKCLGLTIGRTRPLRPLMKTRV